MEKSKTAYGMDRVGCTAEDGKPLHCPHCLEILGSRPAFESRSGHFRCRYCGGRIILDLKSRWMGLVLGAILLASAAIAVPVTQKVWTLIGLSSTVRILMVLLTWILWLLLNAYLLDSTIRKHGIYTKNGSIPGLELPPKQEV